MATSMMMAGRALSNLSRMFAGHSSVILLRPTQQRVITVHQQVFYQSTLTDYPGKPKKPLSSYHLFLNENRQDLLSQHPAGISPQEVMKKLADRWKSLPDQEKETYQYRAAQLSKRYAEEMEDFKKGMTREEWSEMKENKKNKRVEKVEKKKKRGIKKIEEDLGKPKYPGGTVSIYMKECKLLDGSKSFAEMLVGWQNLSDDEKQVYSDKRGSAQAEYRAAMMTWMQEMIARGREDVIQDPAAQKILKDEIRTREEELGKPKPPGTSRDIFMQEISSQGEHLTYSEMASLWNKKTEKEKKVYKDIRIKKRDEYKVALEEWTERMKAEGHTDVLELHQEKEKLKRKGKSKEE